MHYETAQRNVGQGFSFLDQLLHISTYPHWAGLTILLSILHDLINEFMFPVTCDLWSLICVGPGVDIKKWHSNLISSLLTQAQTTIESYFLVPRWPLTGFTRLLPGTRRAFLKCKPRSRLQTQQWDQSWINKTHTGDLLVTGNNTCF